MGALPDGTPVHVVPRHDLPLVRVELDLRLDGRVDPARTAMAALWGEGTRSHPGDAWRAAVDALGATVQPGCGSLRCWIDVEAPTVSVEPALALAGELLREPRFDGVGAWRRAARREWRSDVLAPDLVPELALDRLLWPDGHPFRQDRSPADFRVLRPAAVRDAWARLLAEAQAAVVVVGDVDPATAPALVGRHWGPFPGRRPPADVGAPALAERLVVVDLPGELDARLLVAWAGPARDATDALAYALALRVAGGDFRSRLNRRLREEEGLTYAVRADHQDGPGFGLSVARAIVAPHAVPAALAAVVDALAAAPSGEEIATARHAFFVDAAGALLTLRGLARPLSADVSAGLPPGETYRRVSSLGDVSDASVQAAWARWVTGPKTIVVAGDRDAIEAALEEAGRIPELIWSACRATYGGRCP